MTNTWRTVKVFISSTFRDMHSERDWLVKVVFPALREKLEKYRIHLVDIDMRWGVTAEQAEDCRVLDLCLGQIEKCRPFFIGILGERYGSLPEKYEVTNNKKRGWVNERDIRGKSITELEILHGVLNNPDMYDNSFFFYRDSSFIEDVPEFKRTDMEVENEESAVKLHILKEKIKEAALPVKPIEGYTCTYAGLRVNRRIARMGLSKADLTVIDDIAADGIVDKEEYDSLDEHMRGVVEEYGTVYLEGLDEFGDAVYNCLWEGIKNQLDLPDEPVFTDKDSQSIEADYHERFMDTRTRIYVGRESLQNRLKKYADNDSTVPCLLIGLSGLGKSAALAKFTKDYRDKNSDTLIIPHFIGASPDSTSIRKTLKRFCLILRDKFGYTDTIEREGAEPEVVSAVVPDDPNRLSETYRDFVKRVPEDKKILFVIDALNQLDETDNAHNLNWLPSKLPLNVKFIVSSIQDHGRPGYVVEVFDQRKHDRIEVEPLTDSEREGIIYHLPSISAKILDEEQVKAFTDNPATRNPLFLLVALEELRGFGSFEHVTNRIKSFPREGDTVTELFKQVVERLEEEFDTEIVRKTLSLLAISRNGLSEHELLELIEGIGTEVKNSKSDFYPIIRQLRSYMKVRGKLLDFFHRNLFKAVREVYLKDEDLRAKYHITLAEYFKKKADPDNDKTWKVQCPRGLSELPYHLVGGEDWRGLEAVLCDLSFLEINCIEGMTLELLVHYKSLISARSTINNLSKQSYTQIIKYLRQNLQNIIEHPECLFQLIFKAVSRAETKYTYLLDLMKRWSISKKTPWLKYIHIPQQREDMYLHTRMRTRSRSLIKSLAFSSSHNILLAINDKQEMYTWSIDTGVSIEIVDSIPLSPCEDSHSESLPIRKLRLAGYLRPVLFYTYSDSINTSSKAETGRVQKIHVRVMGNQRKIVVTNIKTHKMCASWRPHSSYITAFTYLSSVYQFATASEFGEIAIWQMPYAAVEADQNLEMHHSQVTAIDVNSSGTKCVSLALLGDCIVWDIEKRTCTHKLYLCREYENLPGKYVSFLSNSNIAFIEHPRRKGHLVNTDTGEIKEVVKKNDPTNQRNSFLEECDPVALVRYSRILYWKNYINTTELRKVQLPDEPFEDNKNKEYIDWGYEFALLNPDWRKIVPWVKNEFHNDLIALSGSGKMLFRVDIRIKKAALINLSSSSMIWWASLNTLDWYEEPSPLNAMPCDISLDGQNAMIGDNEGKIAFYFYDFEKDSLQEKTIHVHGNAIIDCAMRGDGLYAVSICKNNILILWECYTGKVISKYPLDAVPTCCSYSIDGSLISVGHRGGSMLFLSTERIKRTKVPEPDEVKKREESFLNCLYMKTEQGISEIKSLHLLEKIVKNHNAYQPLCTAAKKRIISLAEMSCESKEHLELLYEIAFQDNDIHLRLSSLRCIRDLKKLLELKNDYDDRISKAAEERLKLLENARFYKVVKEMRPLDCTQIVIALDKYEGDVSIELKGISVNGKSIMGVLMLCPSKGDILKVLIDPLFEEKCFSGILEDLQFLKRVDGEKQ